MYVYFLFISSEISRKTNSEYKIQETVRKCDANLTFDRADQLFLRRQNLVKAESLRMLPMQCYHKKG